MANSNIRTRRVSMRQLDLLWEFLNSHRDIAFGFNRSLQAKEYSSRKWQEIADLLNAQGDGAHKDGKMWSKYWVDFKAKLKKRNAAVHSSRRRTGGGPSTEPPLSAIEDKFLSIMGDDFGQGVAGVRVDPFPEASTPTIGTPASQSILLIEDVIEPSLGQVQLEVLDVQGTSHGNMDTAGNEDVQEATLVNPLLDEVPAVTVEPVGSSVTAGPSVSPSPRPSRRRRRSHVLISREDARRLLVQSAQERTRAAVRSSDAIEGVQRSMALIANSIMAIQEDIHDIKRTLPNAFPRAAE